MRFAVEFEIGESFIPVDYRSIFLSYLSDLVCKFKDGESKKNCENIVLSLEKFTFAVYFKEPKFYENYIEISGKKINLNFSCFDKEFGEELYNVLNKNRGCNFYFGENRNYISPIIIRRIDEKLIQNEEVIFKILSPVLIENNEKITRDTKKYYTFIDEGFENFLLKNIIEESKNNENIDLEIIEYKKTVVKHYGKKIPATLGSFKIKADKNILDYIYRAGIGQKTEMGFGMLEVV